MEHTNSGTTEFKEKLVNLGKVTKVVKGGRNFRWSALVVVGDENGRVGAGLGKAAEVSEAIRKGVEDAKKNLIHVAMVGTTIPSNNPINMVHATLVALCNLKTAEEVAKLRGKSVDEILE